MKNVIKSYTIFLLLGVAVVLLVGGSLLLVSLDMRVMAVVAIILSFVASFLKRKKQTDGRRMVGSLFFTAPFAIFFWLVISNDLPSLWFLILAFFISSILGQFSVEKEEKKWRLVAADLILIVTMVRVVPLFVGGDLTERITQKVDYFELTDHEGIIISSEDLIGNTVVIDFYGTWCKPCVAELSELSKVNSHFSGDGQIEFYIVNADMGGDTMEKARKFALKYDPEFKYAYDFDQVAYKKLGLGGVGVPSLLILDSRGDIRLRHIGYNKSETDFAENMIAHLESISNE